MTASSTYIVLSKGTRETYTPENADLERLNLGNNQIRELHNLPDSLRQLHLGTNQFTTIPAEVLQLTDLEVLDLGTNDIHNIPTEIAQMTALRVLRLGKNPIDQRLPATLAARPNLTIVGSSSQPNLAELLPSGFEGSIKNSSVQYNKLRLSQGLQSQ